MSEIQMGDVLQFIGSSISIALVFQTFVFGLWEYTVRRKITDVERLPRYVPFLMVLYNYYYIGLCALPWFTLSVFTCLASGHSGILVVMTELFLIVGWLIFFFAIFDISYKGLKLKVNDWVDTHPHSIFAPLLRYLFFFGGA